MRKRIFRHPIELQREKSLSENALDLRSTSIRSLLYPESIAVIGASSDKRNFPNGILVPNLRLAGFSGKIYPINVKGGEVDGIRCFTSLREIKDPVDLVYIAVPSQAISSVLEDCISVKAGSALAIAANVGEKEEAEIKRKCNAGTVMRFCGPNCEGLITPSKHVNLTFVDVREEELLDGDIGILAQSGGLAASITQTLAQNKVGVAFSLSIGNCLDLDFGDFVNFCATDDKVKVVGMYLEGITKPSVFIESVSRFKEFRKHLVVLKPRATEEIQRQVLSHTRTISGTDAVFDAFLRKYGIIRADNLRNFANILTALSWQPHPPGKRVGIVADTGGYSILLSSSLEHHGLSIAKLSPETVGQIEEIAGPQRSKISAINPVDTDSAVPEPQIPLLAGLVAKDANVDSVVMVLVGPFSRQLVETLGKVRAEMNEKLGKPIYCIFTGADVANTVSKEIADLTRKLKIPVYSEPEDVSVVIEATSRYL